VDLLCGVLSGSSYGDDVHNLGRDVPEGEVAAPRVGHFFMALDIERFMPLAEFEARAQGFVDMVRATPKALDQERIFLPGEKEEERTRLHRAGAAAQRGRAGAGHAAPRGGRPWLIRWTSPSWGVALWGARWPWRCPSSPAAP
jgi:hypothetical protein